MSFAGFEVLCRQETVADDYRFNSGIASNVVIYDADVFDRAMDDEQVSAALKAELNHCLLKGPGVYVVKQGFRDLALIDRANDTFDHIVAEEKELKGEAGDHFAKSGENDRIWNSLQKTCLKAPEDFVRYYSNTVLAMAARAWLGPHYQMTAQVNIVKPGAKAQSPHRDYHLGFQSDETVAEFPLHAQLMSQYLTLQCAVAHTDMPIVSGPTKLLPFSQQYELGYGAWRDPEFMQFFESNFVQYELSKGDIVFFNPALFHAAGDNASSDIHRVANLLQIASALTKPMESIDRVAMSGKVYPVLQEQGLSVNDRINAVAAVCDGYSFPTNLDNDPPIGQCAPLTMAELMHKALNEQWPHSEFVSRLDQQQAQRLA